jgi:hypothetical protein
MNATSKPIDLKADLGDLRRAAADTAKDSARVVSDTVVRGTQIASDGLAELRDKAVSMGLNGVVAVRESSEAVAQHPVVFTLAGTAVFAAGWLGGRNEDTIKDAARSLADKVKQIPGKSLAKDACLVGAGAALAAVLQHACKTTE